MISISPTPQRHSPIPFLPLLLSVPLPFIILQRPMSPLFQPRRLAPMSLHPAIRTVEISVAADALQCRVVVADYAPRFYVFVCVGDGY